MGPAHSAAAFAQRDLKRMFAYSSINHLGYCLLAIFAIAGVSETIPNAAVERSAAISGTAITTRARSPRSPTR